MGLNPDSPSAEPSTCLTPKSSLVAFQYPQALPAPSSHTPTAMEVRGHLHSWVLVPLPRQDCPKAPGRMPGPSHALSSFGRTTNLCQGHGVVSQVWPNSLPQPFVVRTLGHRPTDIQHSDSEISPSPYSTSKSHTPTHTHDHRITARNPFHTCDEAFAHPA